MSDESLIAETAAPVRIAPSRFLLPASLAVAAFAAAVLLWPGSPREEAGPPGIAGVVQQAARLLNAEAPRPLAAGRTLLGVSAEGNLLVFRVGLSEDVPAADVDSVEARLQAADAEALCGDADTSALIGRGAGIERRYTDPDGDALKTRVESCAGGQGDNAAMPMAM